REGQWLPPREPSLCKQSFGGGREVLLDSSSATLREECGDVMCFRVLHAIFKSEHVQRRGKRIGMHALRCEHCYCCEIVAYRRAGAWIERVRIAYAVPLEITPIIA